MKQKALYTERQPDVRYQKLNDSRADVIVNEFIKEEQIVVNPEGHITQTMYEYWTNTFSVDPSMVTETDIKNKLSYYLSYEAEQEKTLEEKVKSLEENNKTLEQANAELTVTVDSILTEVIPSIMGV